MRLYKVITHSAGNGWIVREPRQAPRTANDYTPLSAVDIFVEDLGFDIDTARAAVSAAALAAGAPGVHAGVARASPRKTTAAVIKITGIERTEGIKK